MSNLKAVKRLNIGNKSTPSVFLPKMNTFSQILKQISHFIFIFKTKKNKFAFDLKQKKGTMNKYIAFLRGINVGNIRIKMVDLKACFEQMDCTNVTTYLQTGNVVFNANKNIENLKIIIEKGLSETFNYKAYILLYAYESLSNIIQKYPFEKEETHHAYVIFVENEAVFKELEALSTTLETESAHIKEGNQVLYWKVKIGESLDTPFAKIIAKAKYKTTTTVRNINTLNLMINDKR